jgi:hypothetical protein
VPWRWFAERIWVAFAAWLCVVAIFVLTSLASVWAYHDLLGAGRRTEQRIVYGAWAAQTALWIVALAWAKKRRGVPRVAPPTATLPGRRQQGATRDGRAPTTRE